VLKRLYKTKDSKVFSGVCGGIAEYCSIDTSIVRVLTVVAIIYFPLVLVAYIAAAFILPEKKTVIEQVDLDQNNSNDDSVSEPTSETFVRTNKREFYFGVIIISIGILALLKNLFSWINYQIIVAISVIVAGVFIISWSGRRTTHDDK